MTNFKKVPKDTFKDLQISPYKFDGSFLQIDTNNDLFLSLDGEGFWAILTVENAEQIKKVLSQNQDIYCTHGNRLYRVKKESVVFLDDKKVKFYVGLKR